jgi:hypothetical protein
MISTIYFQSSEIVTRNERKNDPSLLLVDSLLKKWKNENLLQL